MNNKNVRKIRKSKSVNMSLKIIVNPIYSPRNSLNSRLDTNNSRKPRKRLEVQCLQSEKDIPSYLCVVAVNQNN